MTFKEMTASEAIGFAERAKLDIWLFATLMTPDQGDAALLTVIGRVEASARAVLAWCRVKRDEQVRERAKRRKS